MQQNLAKPGQNLSKEKALISFDSLVHFEPFQRVALTPRPFFFLAIVGQLRTLRRREKRTLGQPAAFVALAVRGLSIGAVIKHRSTDFDFPEVIVP
jgi:hypothetical protein